MRALEIHLNGMPTGEGFVIASNPDRPLPSTLSLRTNDGSEADVALRVSPDSTAELTITPSTVHVSSTPVEMKLSAMTPSENLNDTTVEVVQAGEVVARYALTSLETPRVRFSGRFQVRLATNGDPFHHQWGTDASFFRMYAIQGPDPANPPFEPPLNRLLHFQEGVALRPHCAPIGVTVTGIEADLGGERRHFAAGDPLIGLPVRLGPACRFDERDGEFAAVGFQPIADFRLAIGSVFAGASEPALPRPDRNSPHPSKAPYADGAAFMDAINSWKPADFGYPEASWDEHAQAVVDAKLICLQTEEPADAKAAHIRDRRVLEHLNAAPRIVSGLRRVQQFTGEIDRELEFGPHPSGALAHLGALPSIAFSAEFFNFDSDCQSGTVTGTLGALADAPLIPPAARLAAAETRSDLP